MSENEKLYTRRDLVTFAETANRQLLARALGQVAYRGDRDYQEALGYVETPTFDDFLGRYERQDIAARVVDLPAQDTWKRPPAITEGEGDKDDTAFIKAWEALVKRLKVWAMLTRVDRIAGIGRYGVLLIGMRGSEELEAAAGANSLKSPSDVLYLHPFTEERAEVKTFEADPKEPRFGLPVIYKLRLQEANSKETLVHWSRLIHVADNKTSSEIYGIPRLRQVLNRLDDLIKVVGGSAEATWLNMRPGTVLSEKEDYTMADDATTTTAVDKAIREYAHDPLRFLRLTGIDAKQLGPSEVVDPRGPFDVIVSLIAAASNIPQRVLLGSAAGELASAQEDRKQWGDAISSRQQTFAEPDILRAFIDRLILLGALPVAEYNIGTLQDDGTRAWPPLIQPTAAETAEIENQRAAAWKNLQDPQTLDPVGSRDEARAIISLAPDEDHEPRALVMPEDEVEEGTAEAVIAQIRANYDRGEFAAQELAEFAIAEVLEQGGGNGHV